jgi:hypothetical protein
MGTRKTKAQLDTLFADNTSGAIGADDLRDFVETMKQPWGELNFGTNAGVVTTLAANTYTAATFPTTTLNAGSLNVTKTSNDNGLKYTGTPTILAYAFTNFQFSTENDNIDLAVAQYKNAAIASANTAFELTPILSGYGAATTTTATDYRQKSGTVTGSDTASPITVTIMSSGDHGLTTGDQVTIASVVGQTGANGTFVIERVSATTVKLYGSTSAGAWSSGGTWAEVDASGPRPRKGSHSGSIGQIVTLATNDTIKLYLKNADWTATHREDNVRIDNAVMGLFAIGVV